MDLDKLDFDDVIIRTEEYLSKFDIYKFTRRFENYENDNIVFSLKN